MQSIKVAPVEEQIEERASWLDRPMSSMFRLNLETLVFLAILLLGIVSRFYDLETRVMSHDETTHVYFSWRLYRGDGYQHDPMTHGPLQFHLIALSYFLFGDSDSTARIPVVLASIATIALMWSYRRYLGRYGALIAAFLLLISPYMLYYGRYVRNEAYVALFVVLGLWAIMRYLETGAHRYIYWLTAATIFHFTAKETAFIFTAQALVFLAVFFVARVYRQAWLNPQDRRPFTAALLAFLFLLALVGVFSLGGQQDGVLDPAETVPPSIPGEELPAITQPAFLSPALLLGGLAGLALVAAVVFLLRGFTLSAIRKERSFDLLILLGTLILPMLAPFPVKLVGWNPLDYTPEGMLRTSLFLVPMVFVAVGIGLWWNPRLWLINAAFFYGVFTVLYTTLFTNGTGFFTGLIGSLGYWLEQHGVERGNQPWYYYVFLQVPVYEFLPALASLAAFYLGLRSIIRPKSPDIETSIVDRPKLEGDSRPAAGRQLAFALIGFWVITSFFAYSYAGEKMPWLTVHIALPLILLAGWGLGKLVEDLDLTHFWERRAWIVVAILPVFLLSVLGAIAAYLSNNPPFQGNQLEQLRATGSFLTALLAAIGSGWALVHLTKNWSLAQIGRLLTLAFFALLAVLTARTAIRAAYINYDRATEYLVYAHTATGAKEILSQVEEISYRTTDGLALQVAYDNVTTYPFWWYFRNFENQRYYGANPTRDLREFPVIIVGDENYGKIEPVVGQAYHRFEYIRMWWPNQDYFNLTWERIWNAVSDPEWRAAIFQIWFNRDYSLYAEKTGRDMSLPNWQPSARMRMYIRKDIVSQMWKYGTAPAPEEVITDPYEGKEIRLTANLILGSKGSDPGQFERPRDLAVAADGSLYVADTENHRIQQIAPDGSVLNVWGSFSGNDPAVAPEGTFNEPWGIAIGPDGSVYVADTWNHRVQKFSSNGEFITSWGYFGQGENPFAFWGPRDVVVDAQGRVIVSDTGNKRLVVFDSDGNTISQFGGAGFGPGQFDEPVGLALDAEGRLYVADTWNQRIQVFSPTETGHFITETSWEVFAWYGTSLDNKPYLAVDEQGRVYATDPEGYRVIVFTSEGEIISFWGDFSFGADGFALAGSVAADPTGGVWVSDTDNGRLMRFILPDD